MRYALMNNAVYSTVLGLLIVYRIIIPHYILHFLLLSLPHFVLYFIRQCTVFRTAIGTAFCTMIVLHLHCILYYILYINARYSIQHGTAFALYLYSIFYVYVLHSLLRYMLPFNANLLYSLLSILGYFSTPVAWQLHQPINSQLET
jgi:hypothetical protein